MAYEIQEHAGAVNGVPGRFYPAHKWPDGVNRVDGKWSSQTWVSEKRAIGGYGRKASIQVEMRYDDNCKNGHNSFAITANITADGRGTFIAGGCCHDEIAKVFPELEPLIKWHLTDEDGPMHYIANTVFLAGDRDYNGLRKGEKRQLVNGRTKLPVWKLVIRNADGDEVPVYSAMGMVDAEEKPANPYTIAYEPVMTEGKGKERELDAARRVAVWPEATDAELSVEPGQLKAVLEARLPKLIEDFRNAMIEAGFTL